MQVRSFSQQLRSVPRRALSWPVTSQEVARRNAILASTALTQRRVELLEVEEFLATYLEKRAAGPALAHRAG
ncbi:hypothetical protein [Nocardioides iriomotensis]|uniref:Uncharacterized protein n=1 Tax=Nocardioides iriomotensis TaxID=715784 RepID=A0A4Q5J4C8_9ACTN|nr:hypothetical protein [Nocardioides iriomotensis]RYU12265.1 hypothetical protein ETU37_09585 [Nocardioides iriomotensis]